ncbi:MAG: hypothetical protein ABI181_13935, partial [Mycobacteriaceae bacterium]
MSTSAASSSAASSSASSQFGANQWLVDEMYQRYLDDPASVDATWHEFLSDYIPETAQNSAPPSRSATSGGHRDATLSDGSTALSSNRSPNNAPEAKPTPSPTTETLKQKQKPAPTPSKAAPSKVTTAEKVPAS